MIPNQGNIELVMVGNATDDLTLVLASDHSKAYTNVATDGPAAPVQIIRGTPEKANYLVSDVIKWTPYLKLIGNAAGSGPAIHVDAVEDVWVLPAIDSVVGVGGARELNLRVWPVGLSSVDWQRMVNTGHFMQLATTQSQITVATEFAEILDASYKNQRIHGSGGLHCYATTSETGALDTALCLATFTENSKTVTFAAVDTTAVAGGYIKDTQSLALYKVVSVAADKRSATLNMPAVASTIPSALVALVYVATDLDDGTGVLNAGLAIEATPNKFVTGQYNYEKTRLQATSGGMGAITYAAMAAEGNGNWEQVAEREWFSKGNEGKPMRTNNMAPYNGPYLEATEQNYATCSLKFSHNMLEPLGQPNNSPKSIFIAEADAAATALYTLLTTYISQG